MKISSILPTVLLFSSPSLSSSSSTQHPPSQAERDLKWMRMAISTLPSPCYPEAFGAVIVNTTDDTLICTGYNNYDISSDPSDHGEVNAIRNCVAHLRSAPYHLSTHEIETVWGYSTLYTTAEPCVMCAGTILQAGFKRFVYGTSSKGLYSFGWKRYLISVGSEELVEKAKKQEGFNNGKGVSEVTGGVAKEETDELFKWQFNKDAKCPKGCERAKEGWKCVEVEDGTANGEL